MVYNRFNWFLKRVKKIQTRLVQGKGPGRRGFSSFLMKMQTLCMFVFGLVFAFTQFFFTFLHLCCLLSKEAATPMLSKMSFCFFFSLTCVKNNIK